MRAGKLRRVISLHLPTSAPNEYGTPVTSWAHFATLRAEVVQNLASETVTDGGAEDQQTLTFRTRFMPGLSNIMRVTFGADAFNLKAIRIIGNNDALELDCQKIGGVE